MKFKKIKQTALCYSFGTKKLRLTAFLNHFHKTKKYWGKFPRKTKE